MKGLKTGGRQKGTPNKLTSEIREKLNDFVFSEIELIIKNIDTIPIEKRLDFVSKVLPFVIPKMNNIEVTSDIDINLEREITDTEINAMFMKYAKMCDYTLVKN